MDVLALLQTAHTAPQQRYRRTGPEVEFADVRPLVADYPARQATDFSGHSVWLMLDIAPARPVTAIVDGKVRTFASAEEKFHALSKVWHAYNDGKSVIEYNHIAYLQVIGMGPRILPVLFRELEAGNAGWLVAIKCIAGDKAHSREMRGDSDAVVRAWLGWGQRNGYRQISAPGSQADNPVHLAEETTKAFGDGRRLV